MRTNLDLEASEKLSQMQMLEAKLNNTKHELKQLEQLQRKKDEVIGELEGEAGYDKKVIKEVLVDKVRDN